LHVVAILSLPLLGFVACSRPGTPSQVDPPNEARRVASVASAEPQAPPADSFAAPQADAPMAQAGEARRATLPRFEADAALRPHLTMLRDHFGPEARGPLESQRVDLVGGRTALLLSRPGDTDPIALVFDRDDLAWTKQRPTAGIVPPVRHLALAPHPNGGLVVFAWVATLHTVAARIWADDGSPFGDFELFAPGACDALSAAYGPGQGWVVVCASATGTRAQRMREDATTAWGHDGVSLGSPGAAGPATLVFDSPSTLVALQRVAAVGGDRLLAFRYDARAQPLWAAPVELGVLPPSAATSDHLQAAVVRQGVVRVELPRGLVGKTARAAEVGSNAELRLLMR
jgi:hypothetical protein